MWPLITRNFTVIFFTAESAEAAEKQIANL